MDYGLLKKFLKFIKHLTISTNYSQVSGPGEWYAGSTNDRFNYADNADA
jgi:hypothetical protein